METYEEKLSDIANTAKWSIEEFDDFKRFERVIDDAAAKLKTMKKELEEGYVFGGETQKVALECAQGISEGIEDVDIPTALRKLFKTVDAYNQAIDDARNVELPGTRLTSDIEQAIKAAETPLNIVVPGLGTLTGIIGNAGVSLISNMLADKREETAKKEYQRIKSECKQKCPRNDLPSAPVVDINGLWPAQDGENNSSENDGVYPTSFGDTGISAAVAGGAGIGAGGALAVSKLAGGAGSSSGALSEASMAAVSGSGVGSYYANNPVKASIASSSIKGATGMAAGLRKGEIARAEAAASSRANTPGMMGMGRGGASQSKDKRRNSLGYIAPTIEEEEEFQPKPLAAMAGHRRRPGE